MEILENDKIQKVGQGFHPTGSWRRRWIKGCLILREAVLTALMISSAKAQIQPAWVAEYDNGFTTTNSGAVTTAMALDSAGNAYITGYSSKDSSHFGYQTIKYSANGTLLWAVRYDSPVYPIVGAGSIALDASNNVIVGGDALTIKYDSNGHQLWTAPYAGTGLTVDGQGNIFVIGFSTNFGTVKLSPQGSNLWLQTYAEVYGPTVSQSVVVDSGGNAYVSGLDSYYILYDRGQQVSPPWVRLTTIKYGPAGNQLWKTSIAPDPDGTTVQAVGATLDSANNLYLLVDWPELYYTIKYGSDGSIKWTWGAYAAPTPFGVAHSLALDGAGNPLLSGQEDYTTCKLSSNGVPVWTNSYPKPYANSSAALANTVDAAGNCYVTGYSPDTNSIDDIVTIKYDSTGHQVWLQRYKGLKNPTQGIDNEGNAIAVDRHGNVYVAGYESLPGGGLGMITIKYAPVVLQHRADGSTVLEAQGSPGENFDVAASQDLQSWQDLGLIMADTNGLAQYTDTNAPAYPARFYLPKPQ